MEALFFVFLALFIGSVAIIYYCNKELKSANVKLCKYEDKIAPLEMKINDLEQLIKKLNAEKVDLMKKNNKLKHDYDKLVKKSPVLGKDTTKRAYFTTKKTKKS